MHKNKMQIINQAQNTRFDLLLIVDELVEPFGRSRRGLAEIVVGDVVSKSRETLKDFVVALGEEGKRLGIELHGVSLYVVKIAVVAAATPSWLMAWNATRATASYPGIA